MRKVYIVDGSRTPFLKAQGKPGQFSAADLAVQACQPLLARQNFKPEDLDEVIAGCVMASPSEANIARVIALRLNCGKKVPAYTVQRNCASGMQALDSAFKDIQLGRHNLVLAGGTEAMSRAPLLFNEAMVGWFADQFKAKTLSQKFKNLIKFKLRFLVPEIALLKGLTDPKSGWSMGQTAEELAYRFKISRQQMDAKAVESHLRAHKAIEDKQFHYIESLYGKDGKAYDADDGVRSDSSIEKLAKLKPFFDKKFGSVTPGNSSQITDGACFMLLASEEAVKQYNLQPLGSIDAVQWSGVQPELMGIGPAHAIKEILIENELHIPDIDYWEINEAFSAQVRACTLALNDLEYCQQELDSNYVIGEIPENRLNIYGGAVSLGHPVGASGARIVLQLLHILKDNNAKRGIASLCIGGGQGGAVLISRGE